MTVNLRAIVATVTVLVATSIFSLFAAPLLSLIPTDTAYAQGQDEGPSIDIDFDPGHTIRQGEELNFTLTFSGLDNYIGSTTLKYDAKVTYAGEPDIPDCEGAGAGSGLSLGAISAATTTATGTIPTTCPHDRYVLVVTLFHGEGEDRVELTRTASAFRVLEYKVWDLPGSQPSSPAGLWAEKYVTTVDGVEREITRFHVVDSGTSQVYVYDLADRPDEESLTFVETNSVTGTTNPWGIAANASTTWVANDGSGSTDEILAYSNSDRTQRVSADEFTLDSANSAPRGMEQYTRSEGLDYIHVVDANAGHVFQYIKTGNGSYEYDSDSPEDFELHTDNASPTGIFFNSATMLVADDQDDKIYAYGSYSPGKGGFVNLPYREVNDLDRVGNADPAGVWADHSWVYVVDSVAKKIYAYDYPDRPFEPVKIHGPAYVEADEYTFGGNTTTGEIFYATGATNTRTHIGIHRLHSKLVFWLKRLGPVSDPTTTKFELVFATSTYLGNYEDPDFEDPEDADGDNTYDLIISGSAGGFPHAYFPVKVKILDVEPEKPYFKERSPVTRWVSENAPVGHWISPPVEAVNPDGDGTHVYSLDGTDAASFELGPGGNIIVNTDLDYATKNSYSVTLGIRDGEDDQGNTTASETPDDTVDVTINVFSGPAITGATSTSYAENGTGDVGTFTATNPGSGELVWSLEGDDAGEFTIASTTSGATLRFASSPDYETPSDSGPDNVYQITVVAESTELRGELEVTVTVTDVNEAPEFTEGPNTSRDIDEGDQAGRPVGAPIEAADEDRNPIDTLTYSLGGTDSASFDINSSTGQILTKAALDFEGKKIYEVTVEVRDNRDASGTTDTATDATIDVTINVQSVNEPPVLTGTTTVDYPENGTNPVATYNATDPEGHTPIIWGLSGTDEGSFSISGGALSFDTALDYDDGQRSYSVTVEASDGNSTSTLDVTVNITDVNETPEVTGDAAPEFAENDTSVVAAYDDGDPEGAGITWSLAGDDADDMDIDPSGNLTFNSPPDHEEQDTYRVTVQAFDGNSTGTLSVVVTVTDVNEDPEFLSATTSRSVQENAGQNAAVGLPVKAEDPDDGDTLTYTLSGPGTSSFTIDSNGQIRAVSSLDSDEQATYEVTVEVHDGKAADGSPSTAIDDTIDVTITVTDINEPPTLTGTTTVSIAENSGTTVATYSANDPEGVTPSWDLTGDDADDFDITGGDLTFNSVPDHEAPTDKNTDSVYHVTVEVTDGNNTVRLDVTVIVTDVNEAPEFPSTETGQRSVVENTGSGQPVGVPVVADDPDEDAVLTYILSGTNASSFDINSSTGQILTKDALDEDTKATYYVTVEVHDGKADDGSPSTTTDATMPVTITVTGVNEAPVVTGTTATEYVENDTAAVDTYVATDEENDDILWSLSGVDEDDFTISQTGELTFPSSPDFENPTDDNTNNIYNVNVLAADGTSTTTYAVTVTVTNVNEAPEFPSTETGQRSVEENTPPGRDVGAPVSATDPENDSLIYTLSGNDADSFDIHQSTGQILTKDALDYDSKDTYNVVVAVHDGKDAEGNASTTTDETIGVVITLTDINEPPTVTGTTTTEYAENDTRSVETYLYDDQEGNPVTWSLSGTDEDDLNITQFGELEFASSPDYEAPADSGTNNVYNVNVLAADGTSTTTYPVTVTVTNVNEPPAFPNTEDGARSVPENTVAGTDIGVPVAAVDPEGDGLTYILDSTGAEFFDIVESTGQLKSKADLDAERQTTYIFYVDVHDGKDDNGNVSTTSDAFIQVTITIEDVNEPPVVSGNDTPEVAENGSLVVTAYLADDPENSTTSTWSLDGDDKDDFEISDSGVLSFLAVPDYEAQDEYSVTVQNSDGVFTGELAVTVTITNIDERGEIELSSEQPQVGTALTATLEDDDGDLSDIAWTWESHSATTTTWTTVSTTTAGTDTSNSYTPTEGEVGNTLRVTATYTDGQGSDKTAVEEPSNAVRAAPPINYAPEFASSPVTRSIAENTAAGENIGAPVTADDQNSGDILKYALEGTEAASFDIDSGTGQLKTKAALNHEGKDTYTVTVRASDPSNTSDTVTVTINVSDVNEAPDLSGPTSLTFVETTPGPVAIYKHNDPESTGISWDLSGVDADDFTITDGVLSFAATPDEENPTDQNRDNVYYVTVEVSDEEFDDEVHVTVVVTGQNEKPEFSGATTSRDVSENTQAGQNVGSPVSATDPERDDLTYSLSGADAGHFDIVTSTGQILTKGALNYESSDKSYTVTVSVSDGRDANGESDPAVDATIEVTINVIDEDEAPEISGPITKDWKENATGRVANYTADDPENATTTFTVHGPDAADFSITDAGVLSIDNAPDYEDQLTYQITLWASDGQNISELPVTVNITNEEEPGEVTLSPSSPEVGTQVNASLTDPDHVVSSVTWSWHRSPNKANWTPITGQSGSGYTPVDADEGNYLRATASYDDGHGTGKNASGESDDKVPAVNSRPSFSPNIVRSVDENTGPNQPIGDPVTASNDESDDTLVYELGGTDAASFDFSTSTGQLMTKDDLDFETKPRYTVTISVSDGKDINGNPDDSVDATIPVIINVNDVDEAPVVSGTSTVDFDENATGTIASYTAEDPEEHLFTWDLSGTDAGDFNIVDGDLTFKSPPDFETKFTYQVTVVATDSRNDGELAVAVNINNVDEDGSLTLSSRQPQVESVLTATLTDPDEGISALTWTWDTATSTDWTTVRTATSSSGSSDSYTPVDAGVGKSIRVTVSYTDGQGSGKSVTVTSTNPVQEKPPTNVAPTFPPTTDTQLSVPENTGPEQNIGDPVTATDDNNDDLNYKLGGDDAASFDIDDSTGQLKTKAPLDREEKDTYTVTVTATDPSNEEATVTVTITVTDVDEPPTLSGNNSLTYPENNTGSVVTFTVADPEGGDVTLRPEGVDGSRFRFNGNALEFNFQPDFEAPQDDGKDNTYNVIVVADDKHSTTSLPITVTVTNVNEPPQFPASDTGTRSVTENTAAGQNIGAPVSASDPENDSLTYTLSGTDARHFDIDASTGQILAKSELDYESKTSYSVTVSVSDSLNIDGNTDAVTDDSIDITINVIGENEAPVITGATSTDFAENGTRAVASYTGRDPEGGSVFWTVLGTDSAYFAITNSGVLSFDPAPDYEDAKDSDRNNVYHGTVQASDGNNINRRDVTVTVTNVEEPGTVELSSVQPQVDTPLTATLDDPDEVTSAVTWSWQRSRVGNKSGWSTISGATSDSYTPVAGDVGRYLRATASYDDGYSNGKSANAVSENTVRAVPVNNDPPRFLSSFERRSVDENTARGQNVGDPVEAVDDVNDRLTYRLGGTDASMFSIVRTTGQIQTSQPLDYETDTSYSVTVIAADPSNATSSVPVTITVVNIDEPPVAVDDTASATEDGSAVTIDVLTNDSDPEGMQLNLDSVTQPANGSAAIVGTNVEYTPNAGYYGTDSFTYTVSDQSSNSSVGNVVVNVAADSDPTVQTGTIGIQFVAIDGGGERITLSDYFTDPDEDHPPYQATSSDAAIFTVEVSDGYLSITPVGIGVATTTLTVSDTPGINQEFRVIVYRPVVARTNTETVHIVDPAVDTTLVSTTTTSTTGSLSVLFQAGARDNYFQVAIDAHSNNCGVEAPIDHQHVCVLVDLFDLGAQSIEESLDLPSTLHVTLDQGTYNAVKADVDSGDFTMWKGHGPTDVSWSQIAQCPDPRGTGECYELTVDENSNGGVITVYNIEGFSEFAAGTDQPAPPPTEPPTTTPPPTTGGGGSTGGGSGGSGSSGGGNSGGSSSRSRYTSGNQTPQIFGQTDVTFSENDTGPVASYTAEDPDDDDLTWSLLGYDRSKFEISQEGVLAFRSPPDYETPEGRQGNTYWVILQAEDDGRPSEYDVHNVRVTVMQVNELGELIGDAELSLAENSIEGIAQYQVDDPEEGTITWSLSGPDAGMFQIDEQGNLSPAASLDFESPASSGDTNVHSLKITATDNGEPELSVDMDVSVTITNVNEAPLVSDIPDVDLMSYHSPWMIDLSTYFTDPDGDDLGYDFSGDNITEVALAHLEGDTLSIDPVSGGGVSFFVVATDTGGLSAVTSVAVLVTEPGPAPTPAPAVTVPVPVSTPVPAVVAPAPVSTPAPAVVVPVQTPTVPDPVLAPEPEPTFVPLPPLVERKISNQTQGSDSVSKMIVAFALEPVDEPMAEVALPPAPTAEAPQKLSPIDEGADGHSPAPLSATLDGSGDGLSIWLWLLLTLIAMVTAGYAVRMYVIHRM